MANNRMIERRIMCGYSKSISTIGDVSDKIAGGNNSGDTCTDFVQIFTEGYV